MLGRRALLGLGAIFTAVPARVNAIAQDAGSSPQGTTFDTLDLTLDGSPDLSRRASVLVPRGLAPGERVPVLLLLHGLGETTNETAGVRAWIDRYGLLTSHARLVHPPVAPQGTRGDLPLERIRSINDALALRPFGGRMVFVCPYTPNVGRLHDTTSALDRFATWVADVLLPTVRSRTPASEAPLQTGIDGCSLGGWIGLEVFLRRPALFGTWGGVQAAFGQASAIRTADRIAVALEAAGPQRLHIETSQRDPFYGANVALSRELEKRSVAHDLTVLPGPHDQPWLREAGTLEMLLWQEQALRVKP